MRAPSQAIGRLDSSATTTFPAASRKSISKGAFFTRTIVPPAITFTESPASSTFKTGGAGSAITAQEKSFGKFPSGATLTRKTSSRTAVMRTLALPAVSSTPSLSFVTCCTLPTCCHPSATQVAAKDKQAAHIARKRPVFPNMTSSVRFPRAARRVSGGEPLLKKRRSFCAFQATPHGVHHAAPEPVTWTVKREPVGQVNLARKGFHF